LAALIGSLLVPGVVKLEALAVRVPLAICWLWLLRRALPQWQRINHDLAEGQVAAIEGRVQCDFTHSFGLLQFLKYRVHIGDHSFQVGRQTFFQFKHGTFYRVFYTPHAKVLLGALQLPDTPPMLRQEIQPPHPDEEELVRKGDRPVPDLATSLNVQEIAILRLIAAGRSNKEIADELALSVNTIKMYSSQIYRKLGVRRRTEAVAYARTKGFL
jgi:DNA-binding CsgD family transcriptional regulator